MNKPEGCICGAYYHTPSIRDIHTSVDLRGYRGHSTYQITIYGETYLLPEPQFKGRGERREFCKRTSLTARPRSDLLLGSVGCVGQTDHVFRGL